jgi:hypothetical protein
MSRDIIAVVRDELSADVIAPFFAVEIDFDGGPLYVWNGYGNLTIGSKTYIGTGSLLQISTVTETTELEAKGAQITMTGIPSSFLALALQEPYQGRECRIYFGLEIEDFLVQEDGFLILQEDGSAINTDETGNFLTEIFSGELDQMNIEEAAETSTISVTAENVLIKLERPVVKRYTNQDQKSRYPLDKGLEYIADLQDKELFWGKATPAGQTNTLRSIS